ncbi:MAG: type II secretion system protein [Patescibacteria group bacterium]|nr:type II secretion system protein [Patescibacteria group bacterium]MDE2588234.1 type II secretion system protein [Patescibacteria group bacterium]
MLTAHLTQSKQQKGFTLIELLVVIGILAILLAIVLIAINPAKQFGQANDTKRHSDVNAILNAIGAYEADHNGALPAAIPLGVDATAAKPIDNTAGDANICADLVPTYISLLPQDPSLASDAGVDQAGCTAAGGYSTDYTVWANSTTKVVTVNAPSAQTPPITVTR